MSSYQDRKREVENLKERLEKKEKDIKELNTVLYAKASIFWKRHEWLGISQMVYGTIVSKGDSLTIKHEFKTKI